MLVAVKSAEEARRLQIDGFSRQGEKAVEASLDDLDRILDRDDVSVSKVSLNRRNDDREASIIDAVLMMGYSGRVKTRYVSKPYNSLEDFKAKDRRLFEVNEDSLTVYRNFREVIGVAQTEGADFSLRSTSPERWDELRADVIASLEAAIAEREARIEELETTELDDLIPVE